MNQRKFNLLCLFAWIAISCHAQSFLTNGLVAYYPFNGNAHDATGNGNDGFVVGASLCADRFGNTNSAYNFTNVNKYIVFSEPPLTQTDDWSISAWINPASINQNGMAVCMGYDDGGDGDGFEFGIDTAGGNDLSAYLGGVTFIDSGYAFPTANAWYHIVMLRRDGVTRLYVNGSETPNTTYSTPRSPSAFTIGSATGTRFFNGAVDDVRIYNRGLSDDEVQQLYQIERPATVSPQLAIKKAVYITFTNLTVGSTYQVQTSSDLNNWTNVDSPFIAASNSMTYPTYWNVDDWNQLFFRLQ